MTDVPTPTTVSFLRPAADVVFRQLGGGAVVIDLETSRIFELNDTAAWIWAALARGAGVSSILEAVARDVRAAREMIDREVERFVEDLQRLGLVEAARPAPAGAGTAAALPEAGLPDDEPWTPPRLKSAGTIAAVLRGGGVKLPAC